VAVKVKLHLFYWDQLFFFRRNEMFTVERRQWMVAELDDAFVGRGRVEVEAEAKE
jgi:hypothetical protein